MEKVKILHKSIWRFMRAVLEFGVCKFAAPRSLTSIMDKEFTPQSRGGHRGFKNFSRRSLRLCGILHNLCLSIIHVIYKEIMPKPSTKFSLGAWMNKLIPLILILLLAGMLIALVIIGLSLLGVTPSA